MNQKKLRDFIICSILSGFIFLLASETPASEGSDRGKVSLPELYDVIPGRLYQNLGPVGAGKKEISQARHQLRLEAKKMDADAVVAVKCDPGGIRRDGLSWSKHDAYCRGMAIKFQDEEKEGDSKTKK